MCGIAGYLDFDRNVNLDVLYNMTYVIRHRGPDDEGYLLFGPQETKAFAGKDTASGCTVKERLEDEKGQKAWYLGFGHRRLSIIDLSAAGHQPMEDRASGLAITYNGEIYNYIEVREELKNQGCSFCTDTDTEVILKAYETWGENCVEHFNGMWAFVIYDRKNQKLFCSRDRLGAKPFYYYRQGNHFIFGSELKQLCQDSQLKRKINEERLATTLVLRIQDYSEETLLSQVYSLPGGYNLEVLLDVGHGRILAIEKKQYWELDTTKKKDKNNLWYENIRQAVRLRLRSDAPMGIMISGGVDSTFLLNEICCCKNKETSQVWLNPDTFTTCYKDAQEHDETYYAHQVNEALGAKEHLIFPDEKDTLDAYKKMVWHYEDYVPFSTLGAFMTLKEVAKSGVKVIINGQGGDESMLGYERYYAFYLRELIRCDFAGGLKKASYIIKNSRLTAPQLLAYMFYFGMPRVRILKNKKSASKSLQKDLIKKVRWSSAVSILKNKNLDEMIYKEIRMTQLPHILRMDDRGYMAYSMESRVPFIDYRYLEEVVQLSPTDKIKKGYTKYLLREKMEGTIPDKVVWRRNKNGWSSPAARWVERFKKEEVEEMLHKPVSEKYFNMRQIKRQWRINPTGKDVEAFFFVETFMRSFQIEG